MNGYNQQTRTPGATFAADVQALRQAGTRQTVLDGALEAISRNVLGTASGVREVRLASERCRSHHAGEPRRQLLVGSVPSPVQAVSPTQECARTWYNDATWTWGDYYDELNYITYDYAVE